MFQVEFCANGRYRSIFILLHAAIPYDQQHLLKMLYFLQSIFLASLRKKKNQLSVGVWNYVWVFNLIPFIYLSVFIPICCFYYYKSVIQLETCNGDTSNSYFIKDCFIYSDLFYFLYACLLLLLYVCFPTNWSCFVFVVVVVAVVFRWRTILNFDGDWIKSLDCFWQSSHFY